MPFRRFFVLAVVLVLVAIPLAAQTVTGTMQGAVTDRGGSTLPGVTVTSARSPLMTSSAPNGTRNLDLGLYKNFGLPLGQAISLRLECYNVFNHTQWGFPNNDFASSTFGQVVAQANGARTYQAALRLIY